jgi:hypothetical protein
VNVQRFSGFRGGAVLFESLSQLILGFFGVLAAERVEFRKPMLGWHERH